MLFFFACDITPMHRIFHFLPPNRSDYSDSSENPHYPSTEIKIVHHLLRTENCLGTSAIYLITATLYASRVAIFYIFIPLYTLAYI